MLILAENSETMTKNIKYSNTSTQDLYTTEYRYVLQRMKTRLQDGVQRKVMASPSVLGLGEKEERTKHELSVVESPHETKVRAESEFLFPPIYSLHDPLIANKACKNNTYNNGNNKRGGHRSRLSLPANINGSKKLSGAIHTPPGNSKYESLLLPPSERRAAYRGISLSHQSFPRSSAHVSNDGLYTSFDAAGHNMPSGGMNVHQGEIESSRVKTKISSKGEYKQAVLRKMPKITHPTDRDKKEKELLKDFLVKSNQMEIVERPVYARETLLRQSLSKDSGQRSNEECTIREKIDQFKNWHEHQYPKKLEVLKEKIVDEEKNSQTKRGVKHQTSGEGGEERVKRRTKKGELSPQKSSPHQENKPTILRQTALDEIEQTDKKVSSPEQLVEGDIVPECTAQEAEVTVAKESTGGSDEQTTARKQSAKSWKTWRNVNESYAYDDVKKYIAENELMDKEKLKWIKGWVKGVDECIASGTTTYLPPFSSPVLESEDTVSEKTTS